MTRDVICNITNTLSYAITSVTVDLPHGKGSTPASIPANCNNYQIFEFQKTDIVPFGVTGSCSYKLPDGASLVIAFNCPYSQDGVTGTSNCWFYAGIQPVANSGGSIYCVDCAATVDGQPLDQVFDPPMGSTIVANLKLYTF